VEGTLRSPAWQTSSGEVIGRAFDRLWQGSKAVDSASLIAAWCRGFKDGGAPRAPRKAAAAMLKVSRHDQDQTATPQPVHRSDALEERPR
jgi:hypothetical protein